MIGIKEQVDLKLIKSEMLETTIAEKFTNVPVEEALKWDKKLKKEIIYWGQYDIGVSEITKEYAKNNADEILAMSAKDGKINNLYYVDKETAGGKEERYLYDSKVDIVYKIPSTRIGKYVVHSIQELDDSKGVTSETLITDESQMATVDGISHYEPDLSGFVLDKTSIVYYDETAQNSITIPAKEYLVNGKQRTIEKDGETYEFYNYNSQRWGNILIESSGMKSYWVWIPRYSYKEGDVSDIKFIDLNSTPEEGYIIHSDFADGKKGIWVSKYEPVLKIGRAHV